MQCYNICNRVMSDAIRLPVATTLSLTYTILMNTSLACAIPWRAERGTVTLYDARDLWSVELRSNMTRVCIGGLFSLWL